MLSIRVSNPFTMRSVILIATIIVSQTKTGTVTFIFDISIVLRKYHFHVEIAYILYEL